MDLRLRKSIMALENLKRKNFKTSTKCTNPEEKISSSACIKLKNSYLLNEVIKNIMISRKWENTCIVVNSTKSWF